MGQGTPNASNKLIHLRIPLSSGSGEAGARAIRDVNVASLMTAAAHMS